MRSAAICSFRCCHHPFVLNAVLSDLHSIGCHTLWMTAAPLSDKCHAAALQIAALLNRYADVYNLAVVVTNQVSDFFEDADDAASRKASSAASKARKHITESHRKPCSTQMQTQLQRIMTTVPGC
jgi:hypothetical protein